MLSSLFCVWQLGYSTMIAKLSWISGTVWLANHPRNELGVPGVMHRGNYTPLGDDKSSSP